MAVRTKKAKPEIAVETVPRPDRYTLIFADRSTRTAVQVTDVEPFDEAVLYTPNASWVGCVERIGREKRSKYRLVNDDGEIVLPVADCTLLKLDPLVPIEKD